MGTNNFSSGGTAAHSPLSLSISNQHLISQGFAINIQQIALEALTALL